MKCPNCDYEIATHYANGKTYGDAVSKRLEDYGYPEGMNPRKYQTVLAIKTVLSLKYDIPRRNGGHMTCAEAERAIVALDEILPPKEEVL